VARDSRCADGAGERKASDRIARPKPRPWFLEATVLDPAVLPGFLTAVILVVVAPGPDNAYIIAVGLHMGPRAGVVSAAGMALGMVVHVSAAAVGLALLLHTSPWALDAVRLAGGSYLGWLAADTLRGARKAKLRGAVERPSERLVLRRAVLTNVTNPKVILFFAAFLPQFVRAGHGPTSAQLLSLGLIFLLIGLVVDATIGITAGRAGAALAAGGRAAIVSAVAAGLTFATLAAVLLAEVLRDLVG
jgi:threonine/homoserine/homoserine lactone efflux protein